MYDRCLKDIDLFPWLVGVAKNGRPKFLNGCHMPMQCYAIFTTQFIFICKKKDSLIFFLIFAQNTHRGYS